MEQGREWIPYCGAAPGPAEWLGRWNTDPWLWHALLLGAALLALLGCWVAVEIWPRQWAANALAWGLTALALGALFVEGWRLRARAPRNPLAGWNRRIGRGAVAIAAAAVVFGALPSLVFLP